jgi:nucleotide-binding universal stress UspA family protein
MDEMTKILCGIDGQDYSARAAGVAAELAKTLNAQLTFYMVNPAVPGRGARLYLWSEEYVRSTLDEMRRRATWAGAPAVACRSQRATDVAAAIVNYADRHEADYIVVGASGRPGILKVLSGSVSREVIAKANCPVVVVRRTRAPQDRDRRRGIPEFASYGVTPVVVV